MAEQEPTAAVEAEVAEGQGSADGGEASGQRPQMEDPSEDQQQILRLGFHQEVLGHALSRLESSPVKLDFVQTGMKPLDMVVKVPTTNEVALLEASYISGMNLELKETVQKSLNCVAVNGEMHLYVTSVRRSRSLSRLIRGRGGRGREAPILLSGPRYFSVGDFLVLSDLSVSGVPKQSATAGTAYWAQIVGIAILLPSDEARTKANANHLQPMCDTIGVLRTLSWSRSCSARSWR